MTVYIEYAFLENFFFDGVLLSLALLASKSKIGCWRILLSALVGAGFALIYPFLRLPSTLLTLLKFSVGALMCLLAFGRVKTKKERGRYALTAVFFFVFSFAFGGTLMGVSGKFTTHKPFWVLLGFTALAVCALVFVKKLYARRALYAFIYDCRLINGAKTVETTGFYDSGNRATKNGVPVCFLSPDLIYELFSGEIFENAGQVCDEMSIATVTGERKTPLYQGEMQIKTAQGICTVKKVYFAPSVNMVKREYKILLNAGIFEG